MLRKLGVLVIGMLPTLVLGYVVVFFSDAHVVWEWRLPSASVLPGWLLVALSFFLFFLALSGLALNNGLARLRAELEHYLRDGTTTWVVATALGSIVVLLGGGLTVGDGTESRYSQYRFDIIGIFIGVVAGVFVFRSFLDELVPIENVDDWVKRLTEDVKTLSRSGGELVFCFPALNLGHYGYLRGRQDIYRNWTKALSELEHAVEYQEGNPYSLKIVLLSTAELEPFWGEYAEASEGHSAELAQESESLRLRFEALRDKSPECVQIVDAELSEHTNFYVVLNEVAYLIHAWNMPHPRGERDESTGGKKYQAVVSALEDQRVVITAYRVRNSALAEQITRQVNVRYFDAIADRAEKDFHDGAEASPL